MVGRDGKKLQLFVQRASAVSHALWPANLHRGVATGKSAQRRRFIIISAGWWPEFLCTLQIMMPLILAFFSMVVGAVLVAAVVLSPWYLLFIPLTLLSILSGVMCVVIARHAKVRRRLSWQTSRIPRRQPASSLAGTGRRAFPLLPYAPETPMPDSNALMRKTPMPMTNPFVRFLETYDLSSSGVEHFLNPEEDVLEADTAEYPIYRASTRRIPSYPPPTPV